MPNFNQLDIEDILEENETGFFVAGFNMCGFMPDSEPCFFNSFDDAKTYIIDELKEREENEEENGNEETAENYCHCAESVNLETAEFSVIINHSCFWVKENHFSKSELLEQVEEYASNNDMISSESELSEIFDREVMPAVIEQYGDNDIPAINESFNNWSDSLCKDGIIHELQYDQYCYVGKYEN